MVICPYCQKEVTGEFDTCPHCGVTMIYFHHCHRCNQEIATTGILKFCPLCDADFSDQMN